MSHPPPPQHNITAASSGASNHHLHHLQQIDAGGADVSSSSSIPGILNNNASSSSSSSSGTASEASSSTTKKSVVIAVQMQGTLNAFSIMGQTAATWKPVEGKHAAIFGNHDFSDDHQTSPSSSASADGSSSSSSLLNADLAAATNALRNVTITKATLLQSHNTFGVPLGVTINCLPKNEVVDTGDRYTFTTIPNATINAPYTLYEAGESHQQAMEWRKTFGKFNASNLATQDVLEVPNCSYVFVHENHPVVNLLRINKHIVGVDIDDQPRMDGQWLKITKNLFDSSCDTIKTKILRNIKQENLNNISAQLHRLGGVDWAHVNTADALMSFNPDPSWDPATLQAKIKAHEQNFTEKPCTFLARIKLEYEMQRT